MAKVKSSPFCEFFKYISGGTDVETCQQGLLFINDVYQSISQNVNVMIANLVEKVDKTYQELKFKVDKSIKKQCDKVNLTKANLRDQMLRHIERNLSRVNEKVNDITQRISEIRNDIQSKTIERERVVQTDNDSRTMVDSNNGESDRKKTEVFKTDKAEVVSETKSEKKEQTIDFFPLAIDLPVAQSKTISIPYVERKVDWQLPGYPGTYNHNAFYWLIYNKDTDKIEAINTTWNKMERDKYLILGHANDREEARELQRKMTQTAIESRHKIKPFDWQNILTRWDIGGFSCDRIADRFKAFTGDSLSIARSIGLRGNNGEAITSGFLFKLINQLPFLPNGIAHGLSDLFREFADAADEILGEISKVTGCKLAGLGNVFSTQILQALLKRFIGVGIPKIDRNLEYQTNYACPENIPSTAEADVAWLANIIDEKTWKCWVEANNDIWENHATVTFAQRQRLSSYEHLQLWLRGKHSDKEFKDKLRINGWLDDTDIDDLKQWSFKYPTISDLIPFMLRDVFDRNVVERYGYEDEFKAKFTDRAEKLFRADGWTREMALLYWSAHWKNPSNTQLFEMYHRCRGGKHKVGISRWFDKDGFRLKQPIELTADDIRVTEEDVARAIGVNDVVPFWRDRLLYISRPPLTRVDIRRAYDIDAITLDRVYEAYRDLGYDDANAKTLTSFTDMLKRKGDIKRKGRLSPQRVTTLYKAFSITKEKAISLLENGGMRKEDATVTVSQAEIEMNARSRQKCIAAIRKRYMIGDIDEGKLAELLVQQGLDQEQAITLRNQLICELKLKAKEVTAAMLCKWYESFLIDEITYRRRLIRIGYSGDDADRIIISCFNEREEKAQKKKVRPRQTLDELEAPKRRRKTKYDRLLEEMRERENTVPDKMPIEEKENGKEENRE